MELLTNRYAVQTKSVRMPSGQTIELVREDTGLSVVKYRRSGQGRVDAKVIPNRFGMTMKMNRPTNRAEVVPELLGAGMRVLRPGE